MRISIECPRRDASTSAWVIGSSSPRRHPDLPLDEVDVGDHLAHRVLDLEAGVHLEEEELAVLEDELDRPGAVVADRLRRLDRGLAHRLLDAVGQVGCRCLLDQLLVPALGGAVTRGDPHAVAVLVADELDLDVARPGEVALDVHLVAPEEALGFALRAGHGVVDVGFGFWTTFMPRPPPPKAALMHTGHPCSLPNALISSGPCANSVVPGTIGAPPRIAARRLDTLSDISSIAVGRGADELDAELADRTGEVGVLARRIRSRDARNRRRCVR